MKLKSNPAMDPWDIDDVNFPFCGTCLEKWKFLIAYAVLAPSNHNSQPWRFRIREDQLELYADRARASRVSDPNDRELVISCGCALQHLLLAMHHFDLFGGFEILPEPANPDLLARILMGREGNKSMENITLFYAITKRRTNRQRFHDEPLPELTLRSLQKAAEQESAWLHLVCEDEMKHDLADLISEGDRCQWENKSFRAELSKWVHSNRSTVRDGIPGYAQGVDDLTGC